MIKVGDFRVIIDTCGRGGRQGAEDHARVPASGDHFEASERLSNPRPRLVA